MIRAFNATDKLYSSNGDAVILPTKARVKNSDNGDYYLELTCGIEYNDYIQANNIIVAPTPRGDQAFRIRTVTKNKNKLEVKAWHVFYDSQNYLIADSYAVNLNCNAALDHFNNATDNPSPFTVSSNVATINSYRCVRTSLAECINTVLERWGGHLVRDNWNISILQDIGVDNGITIQYKKNLKELTASYDWSNVVTKLMPVGKDGILLDELYIYSDIQYDIPYTKTVSFEQDTILEEDYQDSSGELDEDAYKAALKEDLLTQAVNYLKVYSLPVVNYTLKGNPEKVTDIGDSIEVIDERIGVNILTEVIAYEYDAIANKYVNLEFGNFTNTLSDLLSNISSSTDSQVGSAVVTLMSELTEALDEAQSKIWDALSSSYCIYEGDKILIVDKLPASRATNVIMINSAGIGFSNTGINGQFTTAWTIDGTFNAQAINIINLTADLIKGGTLKLGSLLNQSGKIEVYDEANTLICTIDKNGLIMYASNGSYVVLNQDVGLVGYDSAGNPIYWVTNDSFNMSKAVVTQEITLCNKVRFLPMQITEGGVVVNDGIGLVSYYEE
jgi:phage minor structural protein